MNAEKQIVGPLLCLTLRILTRNNRDSREKKNKLQGLRLPGAKKALKFR